MPLPVAHGLLAASAVVALREPSQSRLWKPLVIGVFLSITPDFDYALNWLRVGSGGWHHGFTHSILFAFFLGLIAAVAFGGSRVRSAVLFTGAAVSHTLLDFVMTESRGVALWWPFADHRYKLSVNNPIDYTWESTLDLLRISLNELILFAPLLLVVILVKRLLVERRVAA